MPATAQQGLAEERDPHTGTAHAKTDPGTQKKVRRKIGLSFDLDVASAYVFRGLNVFQADAQKDQHAMVAPSLSYSIGDTGLAIGYWSAYQITGENISENTDTGIGMEQNLYLAFGWAINTRVSLNAVLTYYFYPFADSDVTDEILPSYLEPGIGLGYAGVLDITLNVAYFAGLQKSLRDLSYVYMTAAIGRAFVFDEVWGTYLSLGFGYKLFQADPSTIQDNMFDVAFDWKVTAQVADSFSLSPGAHFAWTNLTDITEGGESPGDPDTTVRRGPGSEYVVWFDIGMGFDM